MRNSTLGCLCYPEFLRIAGSFYTHTHENVSAGIYCAFLPGLTALLVCAKQD